MRTNRWIVLLVGLLACGLLAAGCGDDEESSSDAPAATEEAATTEDSAAPAEDTSTEETSDDSSEASSPEDVYNACLDVIEGTAAEESAQAGCEQARDAFQQCLDQAEAAGGDAAEAALKICEDGANQTVESLEAAG